MFCFFDYKMCGIVAPRPGDWTLTLCTGRQNLNYWTAREVPVLFLLYILAIMNNASINISVDICVCGYMLLYLWVYTQEWNCRVKW